MSNFISTGIAGLDTILEGGFLRHNSILLKGAPGTGKTSLGIQILLEAIENGEAAIICSFEQFPQQLYRDSEAFGWNLQVLEAEDKLRILYIKPEDLVTPKGHANPPIISRIHEIAEELGVTRLLLDSVTHFNRVSNDPVACRSLLMHFSTVVKCMGITPILTSELLQAHSREYSFEEYLVDEVVMLHNELAAATSSLPQRTIEITKSRGHSHIPGRHPFVFSDSGIVVYPHVLPEPFEAEEMSDLELGVVSSGIKGIDNLMGGGYPESGAAMIAGMSGTFKSSLAGAFLAEGARNGQKGLLITFEETPQQFVRNLKSRGVDLADAFQKGDVQIRHYVPKRNSLDEIFHDLVAQMRDNGVKRVVIDSIDDFERSVDNVEARKDYFGMFLAALKRHGATSVFTQKIQRSSGSNPLADIRYVSMVDTVIYLGTVEIESRIHKAISVLKCRSASPDADLREIACGPEGIQVGSKFHGLSGILEGVAHGQYKATVENIFQPLYFIRDFANMGTGEAVNDEDRRKIVNDIASQLGNLEKALKDHFGFDPEEEKRH
ncbi:MAG: ATPase domain-containing protein [Candidatus Sumerlaeia bacterium]